MKIHVRADGYKTVYYGTKFEITVPDEATEDEIVELLDDAIYDSAFGGSEGVYWRENTSEIEIPNSDWVAVSESAERWLRVRQALRGAGLIQDTLRRHFDDEDRVLGW